MSPVRAAGGGAVRLSNSGKLGHVVSGTFQQRWPPLDITVYKDYIYRQTLVNGTTKPDATNTGVYVNANYLTVTNSHTPTSNTTYQNLDIQNVVNFKGLSNVKYINCFFRGVSANPTSAASLVKLFDIHGGGHQFIDCTFKPMVPHFNWNGAQGYGFTMIRCDISECTDAVEIFNNNNGPGGATDLSLKNGPMNVVIKQSYLHDNAWFNSTIDVGGGSIGSHSDGIQWEGGTTGTITGNTITGMIGQKFGPNSYGSYTSNAAVLIKPDVGLISNLTIDNNWIDGGSFSINISNDAPDRMLDNLGSISGNKFGRNQRVQSTGGDNTYTISMPSNVLGTFDNNVYEDNGHPVNVRHNG